MTDPKQDAKINTDDTHQPRESPQEASEQQAEMQRLYCQQQSRMRCIGCGEGEEYF